MIGINVGILGQISTLGRYPYEGEMDWDFSVASETPPEVSPNDFIANEYWAPHRTHQVSDLSVLLPSVGTLFVELESDFNAPAVRLIGDMRVVEIGGQYIAIKGFGDDVVVGGGPGRNKFVFSYSGSTARLVGAGSYIETAFSRSAITTMRILPGAKIYRIKFIPNEFFSQQDALDLVGQPDLYPGGLLITDDLGQGITDDLGNQLITG